MPTIPEDAKPHPIPLLSSFTPSPFPAKLPPAHHSHHVHPLHQQNPQQALWRRIPIYGPMVALTYSPGDQES